MPGGVSHHSGNHASRCSFPLINAQIIRASERGDVNHLLHTIAIHLPSMNLVNLSTAVHRLAKLTANDPERQSALRQHRVLGDVLSAISAAFDCLGNGTAQTQSLSNVVWSLATMRLIHKALIEKVAALSADSIAMFKPFELSTLLWALAKLGTIDNVSSCSKPVFRASANHMTKHAEHFGFRCLATTVWAFATAKQHNVRLFRSISAQMLPMVHVANCQEMANTAWAFGTVNFHDDHLFSELASKAIARLGEFKPQELSNMLWGFASNGFFHEAFYRNASLVAQHKDLRSQHLANILWAFGRVQPHHAVTKATILALLPQCTMQIETFKPQEVSATLLAVAKSFGKPDDLDRLSAVCSPTSLPVHGTGHCNHVAAAVIMERLGMNRGDAVPHEVAAFFLAAVPWALSHIREFSAQSLANTITAYAMVRTGGAEMLIDAIGNEVLKRRDSLDATMLLYLLKGFAINAADGLCNSPHVLRTLAVALAHRVSEFTPQEVQVLARICSGLCAQDFQDCSRDELKTGLLALAAFSFPFDAAASPHVSAALTGGPGPPPGGPGPGGGGQGGGSPTNGAKTQGKKSGKQRKARLANAPVQNTASVQPPQQQVAWPNNDQAGGHSPLHTINEGPTPSVGVHPYTPLCRLNSSGQMAFVQEDQFVTMGQTPTCSPMAADSELQMAIVLADLKGDVHDAHLMKALGKHCHRPRLPMGSPGHTDFKWRCSVKNGFIHVASEDSSDDCSTMDSLDGGSSQRSSSLPSRLGCEEPIEDWPKQCPDANPGSTASRRYNDLQDLDFEWGKQFAGEARGRPTRTRKKSDTAPTGGSRRGYGYKR